MIVVISGGDRLSSKRSLSASASSILISGRPGIMVSVFVFAFVSVSLSWPVEGVYSSTWISGSSCNDMQSVTTMQSFGGVHEQSSGKKKQLSQ